jgi:hypothetical protein
VTAAERARLLAELLLERFGRVDELEKERSKR